MTNTPIPLNAADLCKFDYSSLTYFKVCPYKWYLSRVLPKSHREDTTDIVAGTSYAKALETFRLAYFYYNKPKNEALQLGRTALVTQYGTHVASKAAKTLDRVLAAYDSYHKRWPIENEPFIPIVLDDSIPGIELHFVVKLHHLINPITHEPLFYSGRIDFLTLYRDKYYIVDDKTTASFHDHWEAQWLYSDQMPGYVWAVRELGYHAVGAIIRGTALQVKRIDHRQSLTTYEEYLLDRWFNTLSYYINRIYSCLADSYFPPVGGYPCTRCSFSSFCALRDADKSTLFSKIQTQI